MTIASKQFVADRFGEPREVAHVAVGDVAGELDLDREDAAVRSFDDEVDLAGAPRRPEVLDARLGCLGVGADRERHQRFEQGAEQRSVARDRRPRGRGVQEAARIDAEEPCRERRIRELVLVRR